MIEKISAASLAGMVFTACLSVGIPVAAVIFLALKKKAKVVCALIGAAAFIVFALILEPLLHAGVKAALGEKLTGNIWLLAGYGGLAAGLFEETGRLLSMKFLMKKTLTKENAIMYGVGHGGAEAVLLIGLTYISNITASVMINMGLLEASLASLDGALREETIRQLSALWMTPSGQFFLAGIERLAAFVLHLCLSYIVYRCVKEKKPIYYLLAVGIHFLVDAGIVLLASAVSPYLTEAVLVLAVALLAILTCRSYRAEGRERLAQPV